MRSTGHPRVALAWERSTAGDRSKPLLWDTDCPTTVPQGSREATWLLVILSRHGSARSASGGAASNVFASLDVATRSRLPFDSGRSRSAVGFTATPPPPPNDEALFCGGRGEPPLRLKPPQRVC